MKIRFASLAIPPFWEQEALLLVECLRKFGGALSTSPFTVLALEDRPLPADSKVRFLDHTVDLAKFTMDQNARMFPLALVPFGAAAAEQHAQDAELLVWLLPDTLILNPPLDFQIDQTKKLAYRPVHHQNIGSAFSQPLDAFWQKIYQHCEVPQEPIFPMETCYRELVRPYFNAGILVTRPEDGFFQTWREVFQRTYGHADFTPFFQEQKYAVFMHQAILSGIILNHYVPGQLAILPESYNYPLHLHPSYPPKGKAAALQDLTTARYENLKQLPGFIKNIEVSPSLSNWLAGYFAQS
jgi:hypothetical protein